MTAGPSKSKRARERETREEDIMREMRGRSHCVMCRGSHDRAWKTPMWVGGRDSSHHSATLRRMARANMILQRRREGHIRPSYIYRRLGLELCPTARQLALPGVT